MALAPWNWEHWVRCMDVSGPNGDKAKSPKPQHMALELRGCCGDSVGTTATAMATTGTAQCQGWGQHWWCWGLVTTAGPLWVWPFFGEHIPLVSQPLCNRHFRRDVLDTALSQITLVKALAASRVIMSPDSHSQRLLGVTWGDTRCPAPRTPWLSPSWGISRL